MRPPRRVCRRSPDDMRDAIFAEFAQQQFLSRMDLMQSSRLRGQKQKDVNAVLTSLCDLIKIGPNKGDFQLKPEFRA